MQNLDFYEIIAGLYFLSLRVKFLTGHRIVYKPLFNQMTVHIFDYKIYQQAIND